MVEINVLQGERELAKDNKSIGKFNLDGIAPAPRGVPQIEVMFDIDANGILNISAKDTVTGKEQKITIKASGSLSREEIDRMVREAKENSAQDSRRKVEIEDRNKADHLAYEVDKSLKTMGDKIPQELKEKVNLSLERLRAALKGNNADEIRSAYSELSSVWNDAVAKAYSHSSGASENAYTHNHGGGAAPDGNAHQERPAEEPGKGKEEEVIDADYKVVD